MFKSELNSRIWLETGVMMMEQTRIELMDTGRQDCRREPDEGAPYREARHQWVSRMIWRRDGLLMV